MYHELCTRDVTMSRVKEGKFQKVSPQGQRLDHEILSALLDFLEADLYQKKSLDKYGQQTIEYKLEKRSK